MMRFQASDPHAQNGRTDTTHDFLSILHRGGKLSYWWSTPPRRSIWWNIETPAMLPNGRSNVYVGIHPVDNIPPTNAQGEQRSPEYVRSQIEYVSAVNCLFAEFDAKDFGGDKAAAWKHVEQLDPKPSAIIDSGGGYHCYWLLDETWFLHDEADRHAASQLQAEWVEYVQGDDSSKDLARVLRVPGTKNYKYNPPRDVKFVCCDLSLQYSREALIEAITTSPAPESAPRSTRHNAYGQAALAGEIATLTSATEGERNKQLNKSAFALGQLIADGVLDRSAVEAALAGVAHSIGLNPREILPTIRSGIESGIKEPRDIPERPPRLGEVHGTPHHPGDLIRKFVNSQQRNSFPVHTLPSPVREYIEEQATALGVPPEMIAGPFLAIVGGVIGRNYRLQIKRSYVQPSQMWVVVVAEPGKAKSPALSAARAPLDILQKEAKERHDGEMALYELALQEKGKKDAGERPTLESFFTTNATPEALHRILQHSKGVTIIQDELAGWVRGMDAYKRSRSGERQAHLGAWSGVPLKIDRKGEETILIPYPVYSVTGCIQPDLLTSLEEEGKHDGFLDRFLWTVPNVPPRRWVEDDIQEETLEIVVDLLRKLRNRPYLHADEPISIGLTEEAKQLWIEWYDKNGIQASQASGLLAGMYAKLDIQLARLALILHLLTDPTGRSFVSLETMNRAIELVEFFRQEAKIVVGMLQAYKPQRFADEVLQVLQSSEGEWMSKTDLFNHFSRNVSAAELDKALATLLDEGVVEQKYGESTGGRKPELWRAAQKDTADELTNLRIKSAAPTPPSNRSDGSNPHNNGDGTHEAELHQLYAKKDFAGLMKHCLEYKLDYITVLDEFEAASRAAAGGGA